MDHPQQIDKARLEHWENLWQKAAMPAPMQVESPSLNDYPARAFHEFFLRTFERLMLRPATMTRKVADRLIRGHLSGDLRPAFYDVENTYAALRAIDDNFDVIDA